MPDFLLEIGTEEIPDWMIADAVTQLATGIWSQIEALANRPAPVGSFGLSDFSYDATPRRLAVLVKGLPDREPDKEIAIPGPYLSAGEKAAEGFARKHRTTMAALATTDDSKGKRFVFRQIVRGPRLIDELSDKLPDIIEGIRFPRVMYWTGKGGTLFIRPIRWIVALLDHDIVPFEVARVKSGNVTRGHRILGSPSISVTPSTYMELLRKNFVIVRAEERRHRIKEGFGAGVQDDPHLVKVLGYMTEFPTPIRGSFDPSYLGLPKEILSTVMRHHQRYFSVVNSDGSLAPAFIAVTNTDGDPDGLIRQGNERVLRARFNDARFFWQVDQQRTLFERVRELEKITFHAKLGNYGQKTLRVIWLAENLANVVHADLQAVRRAAELCKADLTTDMVKEFTDLQGAVGGLYATAQGEPKKVADAIYDHYKPVSMEDSIPCSLEGQVLSIADKLDTLRECFQIGLIPTGSKDPFALRRAAQGVVKILFEARLPIDLLNYVQQYPGLAEFMRERIEFYLREIRGYPYDEVNAVMAAPMSTLPDVLERLEAVHQIRATPNFEPLATSFKRIKNILKQAGYAGGSRVDKTLLPFGSVELELQVDIERVKSRQEWTQTRDYVSRLALITSLRETVDLFFDKILVNDPNPAIRQNRLALLYSLLAEFSSIADFSEIVTSQEKTV